ncbi:MAG: hypothetical protein LBS84_05250 [Clostridiales bacterium]|nr:hypothetical protein [Clostridiales bacterium]
MNKVTLTDYRGAELLRNISFHIGKGEIMGLICLNNHGLDALVDLIRQNTPIRCGHVYIGEKLINSYRRISPFDNPAAVIDKRGRLLDYMSMSDNIFVIRPGFKRFIIPDRALDRRFDQIAAELDLPVSGRTWAADLSPLERCAAELVRASATGAVLVIIRDISDVIMESELARFHDYIRRYASKGMSFLYISNYHDEISQICNRAALMSNGEIIKILSRENLRDPLLIDPPLEVRDTLPLSARRAQIEKEEPALTLKALSYGSMNDFTLSVHKGECLLIFDQDNSIAAPMEAIMSVQARPRSGGVFFNSAKAARKRDIYRNIMVIGENPIRNTLFHNMSFLDNFCFPLERRTPRLWLDNRARRCVLREYREIIGEDINAEDISMLSRLSLYNLIYHRVCLFKPKAVFCVQPMAETDLRARRHVLGLIRMLRDRGIAAVILASSLRDNLIAADRVVEVENGRQKRE